jgi:hypothetical protein
MEKQMLEEQYTNIQYWLREIQLVTDGVWLQHAAQCRIIENVTKMSWIIPAQNMAQWWVFVVSDEPAVRISNSAVIKHNVVSGTSQLHTYL